MKCHYVIGGIFSIFFFKLGNVRWQLGGDGGLVWKVHYRVIHELG